MKYCLRILIIVFILPLFSYSQDYKITGTIIDEITNSTLPYVNVILKTEDDNMIDGVNTDMDGHFTIATEMGKYILEFSYIGYESKSMTLEINEDKDLEMVSLKEVLMQLDGVVITARRPTIKRERGVLTMDVENTSLSQLGDAFDIMRQTPSLSITPDNAIKVFGKGNAQVYVDGRRIENSAELNLINSNNVSKIEVIRNPSAKYDAEGNAVVLITTKKNNIDGFNSKLTFRYDKREFSSWVGGINLNYKKGRVNFYGLYDYRPTKGKNIDEYERVFLNDDLSETTMTNKVTTIPDFKSRHNFRFGTSIELTNTQKLDMNFNSAIEGNNMMTDNINQIINLNDEDLSINTLTNTDFRKRTNSFNLNYSNDLDTLGRKLSFISNYAKFKSSSIGKIDEEFSNEGSGQQKSNSNENNIDIFTTTLDYTHPIGEKITADIGVKYTRIDNSSDLKLLNLEDQSFIEQEGLNYEESIYAAYGELKKEYEKLQLKVGLRVENTTIKGASKINNEIIIDSSYINFFPSVAINYDLSEDLELGFYYNKRISRPDIQDLNPFVNYIDSYSIIRGNSNLRPERVDEFEMSVEYLDAVNLELSYNRTKQPINDFLFNEDYVTVSRVENFKSNEQLSAGLSIPYEVDWWTIYNYIGVSHVFNTELPQEIYPFDLKDKTYWEFLTQSTFKLPRNFDIGVTYLYTSNQRDGIFNIEPIQILNLSAGKKMLNDQLNLRFIAQDVLRTYNTNANLQLNNLNINVNQFRNVPAFIFSVTYNFGKNFKERDEEELPELDRISDED